MSEWSWAGGSGRVEKDDRKKKKKKKEIIYSTEVLKCNLCDYSDAFILVRGDIAVTADPETQVALKKCAPFTKCIIKIDGTTIWCWIFRFSHANIQFNRL